MHGRSRLSGKYFSRDGPTRSIARLADAVLAQVFPTLARAIAAASPAASVHEIRQAAQILVFRLLVCFQAGDRAPQTLGDACHGDGSLCRRVRVDVGHRKNRGEVFSAVDFHYWSTVTDLCRALGKGGGRRRPAHCPGGLFATDRAPLLDGIRLADATMADVIDALSFARTEQRREYIDYRDVAVQQLGSIHERLLAHEVIRRDGAIHVRADAFARKGSGSFYTPEDLIALILRETIGPLAAARLAAFKARAEQLAGAHLPPDRAMARLRRIDPAHRILQLRICDPAMGAGHFLVALVDAIADLVIHAMAEAEASVACGGYVSPVAARITAVRNAFPGKAGPGGCAVDAQQVGDRAIIRRMVLQHCIHGVDKDPMAVDLAKAALWLHSLPLSAPPCCLDQHLRCGDSLFGAWIGAGIVEPTKRGSQPVAPAPIGRVAGAASQPAVSEARRDAAAVAAQRYAASGAGPAERAEALHALLSLIHALDWLDLRNGEDRAAVAAFFAGEFGDPVPIALAGAEPSAQEISGRRFAAILARARQLIAEERFLHWQVAFPGVWTQRKHGRPSGGFDAVIGNPPWDRLKLQQVEWFAARHRGIALARRAADRTRMVAALRASQDQLARDFAKANDRAEAAARMARSGKDYPLLSGGDVNLYSLFVERAMTLVKRNGVVGLLVPSGIASDLTAAPFFKRIAGEGRLRALYDFENRRTRYAARPFFPDIDSRFKFCAFVAGPLPSPKPARCGFFLQDVAERDDPERCFPLAASDFARVNPNTGTAPCFRSRRAAELTTAIYQRLPVLADRSMSEAVKAWPVRYRTMFHMSADSRLFRTKVELARHESAVPIGANRFASATGEWLPLYEGKMVQAFDHRAASVVVNSGNRHRAAQPQPATPEQHQDPCWLPEPQFWVPASQCGWADGQHWVVGFKEITAPTNARTFISAVLPAVGFSNKVPLLVAEAGNRDEWLLAANCNATIFDFVARQKIHGQTLNRFIVEQLPVVPRGDYETVRFGATSARDLVKAAILELSYTAHDMAPFAQALGFVDDAGRVRPPFVWEEERRLVVRARLDAVYFHLYGVTDADDVRYVFASFPIIARRQREVYGRYRSLDLCLAHIAALAAGDPDAAAAEAADVANHQGIRRQV